MASIACNGCNVFLDGTDMNNTPHTGHFSTVYNMYGNGQGALTGISNSLLGTIGLYYRNSTDGACLTYTGTITTTGTQTGWVINPTTGCTGRTDCSSNLLFYYVPNPSIFAQFPGSTVNYSVTSFSNSHLTGLNIQSGTSVPGGPPTGFLIQPSGVTQPCGTISWYSVSVRVIPSGGLISGFVLGQSGHRVECTYCSQYEMVEL